MTNANANTDAIGVERFCCRKMLLTCNPMIEQHNQYSSTGERFLVFLACLNINRDKHSQSKDLK